MSPFPDPETNIVQAEAPPAPPPPLAPQPVADPPWTGWDVLKMAALALLTMIFLSVFLLAIVPQRAGIPIAALSKNPRFIIPVQMLSYLVLVIFMYALVVHRYGRKFAAAVRWHWPHAHWLAFCFAGALLALAVQMGSSLLPIPRSLPIDKMFSDPVSAWMMAFFGVAIAPLVEELFFRGFLYPVLARRLGIVSGIALTAAVFAVVHASQLGSAWAPILIMFVVGVVFTSVRAITGSVAASFLLHIAYNTTLFTFLYVGTSHFRHLEKLA